MNTEDFSQVLSKLRAYVEREDFKGYDPYDALNSRVHFSRFGKWGPVLAIQLQKRNPINIRSLLGIEKDYNPKGIGLLLHAYSTLYEHEASEEVLETTKKLFEWLCNNPSKGYSGYCWGYNFDWANPAKYLPAFTPSIVVTGFVGKGIFKYHHATKDPKALDVLRSSCDFILHDLPRSVTEEGICFSYTPVVKDACYNASMLGAELFAKVYSVTGEEQLRDLATQAVEFVLARQFDDGHWNYSLDLESGQERRQIDFHQGFVLDSLHAYLKYTQNTDPKYRDALARGGAYYRHAQFAENGRSLWRLPKTWPVDIHHQAQGIITFSKLAHLDPEYFSFAEKIAAWTIAHMQDEEGFFYYRRGRFFTNRIPYMRWGQAWMMVGLSELLNRTKAMQGSSQTEQTQSIAG